MIIGQAFEAIQDTSARETGLNINGRLFCQKRRYRALRPRSRLQYYRIASLAHPAQP